jgi:integrase
MASLHKDPRGKSPYWYAAFVNSDGKRCFRSTKHREFKKAEAVAQGWERAARKGRDGVLSEIQCREVLSDIHERVNGSSLKFQTAEDYLKDWLKGRKALSTSSTRIYGNAIKAFQASLGLRKAVMLAGIGVPDFKRFQNTLLDAGKAPKTVNLEYGIVRSAFDDARRQQLILSNPAEAIENLSEDSARRRTFTRDQVKELLKVADNEWKGMIIIGRCHALRLGDVANLTWMNVGFERRTLVFKPQKQQRRRQKETLEIPLHPDTESYLLSLKIRSNKPNEPIFPTLYNKPVKGESGLSAIFVG